MNRPSSPMEISSKTPSSARSTNYTPQQAQAITTRASSVALAAGAGCGKTFVLTERFLAELDPRQGGRELSGLVAITFTERAAREMRGRIRQACRERLQKAAEEEVPYWLKIVRDVDSARISTIHSFCGSLLRANAPQAGLDPQFSVIEGAVSDPLRRQAVSQTLERLLADRHPATMLLVRQVGLEKVISIADRLILMRFELRGSSWAELGAAGLKDLWREKFEREHLPQITEEILQAEELEDIRDLIAAVQPAKGVMIERWTSLRDTLENRKLRENLLDWLTQLRNHATVKGATAKDIWPSPEIKEEVTERLKAFRDWIDKAGSELQFVENDIDLAAELGDAACQVAREAIAEYDNLKRAVGGLDFDDLLTGARDLLASSPEVRQRAAAGIEFLMVDEFQDTDPTQAEIVRALVGEGLRTGKLFLVGDSQQSIYRFRRADPRVFAALQQEIPEPGRLPLTRNFRSQPAVLSFVNAVFSGERGVPYEPLVPFDPVQYSPAPSIEFLFSEDEGEERETAPEKRKRESEWIARRIRQLLADPTPRIRISGRKGEPPELRPVRAGDIVILFRALSDVQFYETSLRQAGLDYYLVGGKAFYSQQEVFDIANLCRFLHDPTDQVSLLGVLRSPFFNLSEDVVLAVWRLEQDLWAGLRREPPSELNETQRDDVRRAGRTLGKLLDRRDRSRIAPLLRLALDLTGYDAALLLEFLGERKLANLQKLIEMARKFDQVGLFGLSEFVDQLNTAVFEEADEELAATHPEASNVVRLMTIHQSKGLEFPVVILADMERISPPRGPEALFDAEFGTLVALPSRHGRKPVHPGMRLYLSREKREEQAESLRLLYVALTRAADHLILSAAVKDLQQPRSPWLKKLAERFDLQTGLPALRKKTGLPAIPQSFLDSLPEILVHDHIPEAVGIRSSAPRTLPLGQFMESVLQATADKPLPRLNPERIRRASRRQISISLMESALESALELESVREAEQSPLPVVTSRMSAGPEEISAEELGTLVHAVLERLDFRRPESLDAELKTIGSSSRTPLTITHQELARHIIEPFLSSPAARDMAAARRSYRELDFLLHPKVIHPSLATQDLVLSGTIDQLLELEDGRWVVVDFKTGRRLVDDPDRLRAEYELQMGVYALAVEQILGRLPDEVWLIHLRQADPVVRLEISPALLDRIRTTTQTALDQLLSTP